MHYSRREFLRTSGAASVALAAPELVAAQKAVATRKPHFVTLSFDDGFKKSFLRTAEIYEKHKLSACLNIVAAGLPEDAYIQSTRTAWTTKVGAPSAPRTWNVCWNGFSPSEAWRSSRRVGRWRSTPPEIGNRPQNEPTER
jgi:hypothetical protein